MSWWRTGRIFFRLKVEFWLFSSLLGRYSVTSIWRPPECEALIITLQYQYYCVKNLEFQYQNWRSRFKHLDSMMLGSTVWCYCVSSPLLLHYSVALPSLPIIAHANSVGCPLSFHLIQVHRLSPVRCLHAFLIARYRSTFFLIESGIGYFINPQLLNFDWRVFLCLINLWFVVVY